MIRYRAAYFLVFVVAMFSFILTPVSDTMYDSTGEYVQHPNLITTSTPEENNNWITGRTIETQKDETSDEIPPQIENSESEEDPLEDLITKCCEEVLGPNQVRSCYSADGDCSHCKDIC